MELIIGILGLAIFYLFYPIVLRVVLGKLPNKKVKPLAISNSIFIFFIITIISNFQQYDNFEFLFTVHIITACILCIISIFILKDNE